MTHWIAFWLLVDGLSIYVSNRIAGWRGIAIWLTANLLGYLQAYLKDRLNEVPTR